jgi:hypothetical protein
LVLGTNLKRENLPTDFTGWHLSLNIEVKDRLIEIFLLHLGGQRKALVLLSCEANGR